MRPMTPTERLLLKLRGAFVPDGPTGDRRRGSMVEPFLKAHGENFKVASAAFIYNPNGLSVGNHVYVGFGSYLGQGEIVLEDEVLIGSHATIVASNHLRKERSFRFGGYRAAPVRIGRGTWIAGHAVVTAGVTIGQGCLVAAGAVVTKDFGDDLIIGGVPARVLGEAKDDNDA